jgi:hypothetical protein
VPFVNTLVVLDADGDRLFAKYYDGRKKAEQIANELMLYKKTKSVAAKVEGLFHVLATIFLFIVHQYCFSYSLLMWYHFLLPIMFPVHITILSGSVAGRSRSYCVQIWSGV